MKKLISILLYHANKYPSLINEKEKFYLLKSKIVRQFGTIEGYDLQYIEPKFCRSCSGTGAHERYGYNGKVYKTDECWTCHGSGYFRYPQYNVLQRFKMGKYTFHQPVKRFFHKNQYEQSEYFNLCFSKIDGYIEHSAGSRTIANIFFMLFMTKSWVIYYRKATGRGYYPRWNRPYNILNNIIGLFRSDFIRRETKKSIKRLFIKKQLEKQYYSPITNNHYEDDDLPF